MCMNPAEAKKLHKTDDDKMYICSREIVSKVGYLLGVTTSVFEDDRLDKTYFDELNQYKEARIVRNLCILYTMLNRHFAKIQGELKNNLKNLDTIENTSSAVKALQEDELDIVNANYSINKYRPMVAREIRSRIGTCSKFFPEWVVWEYIEKLFQFPTVEQDKMQRKLCKQYTDNMTRYPYGMYLKWNFGIYDNSNSILLDDETFLSRLYRQNNCQFTESDQSKVRKENLHTQQNIERFLAQSNKTVALVDCENCDPMKFYALLESLSSEAKTKIQKIILFDDVNASSVWRLIDRYTSAAIDHCMTERLLGGKSVVDLNLVVSCCQEHYVKNADSFLLFSSDSDYWSLISKLDTARFYVMFEHEKTSDTVLEHLTENGVPYCFIDRFYHFESSLHLREDVVRLECEDYVKQHCEEFKLNLNEMLTKALSATRITMSDDERDSFKKYLFNSLCFDKDDNDNVTVTLPPYTCKATNETENKDALAG